MNGFGTSAPPSFSIGSPISFPGSPGASPIMMSSSPYYQGFCPTCYQPTALCVCNIRECRKESKELLVTPQVAKRTAAFTISADIGAEEADVFPSAFSELMRFMRTSEPTEFARTSGPTEETADSAGNRDTNSVPISGLITSATHGLSAPSRTMGGMGVAFIGGGCCVYLAIEYMSTSANSMVLVLVLDSEGTTLGWMKNAVKPGYYIKEGIISTKPGAILGVLVRNIIARVRWCEVFSC
jgi:hypothetical protein